MASLILVHSPAGGTEPQTFPLDLSVRPKCIVGRQRDASPDFAAVDIATDDGRQSVSRHHAEFTVQKGRHFVQNLGRNGTRVNSVLYRLGTLPHPLEDDDEIEICDFRFRFQDDEIDNDGSTIRYAVNRGAAQQYLESASAGRLRSLLEISGKLAEATVVADLLPEIAAVLNGLFDQAERVFVFLLDGDGKPAVKASKCRGPVFDDRFSHSIIRKCLRDRKAYLSDDAKAEVDLVDAPSIAAFQIHSFLCAPVLAASGQPLGALQLDTHNPVRKFGEEDLKLLTAVANMVGMTLERIQLHAEMVKHLERQFDIEHARKVQLRFLPNRLPHVPGYDFFAFYEAAKTVGGDYYDFIELPDGRLAILLGDVAGKGVPASLMMAKLSAEARSCMLAQACPAKALGQLSDRLILGGIEGFVTLAALVLDPVAHAVTLVNAGHMVPIRYHCGTGEFGDCLPGDGGGYPLGVELGTQYHSQPVSLAPGEALLVFTDGVTDAMCPANKLFGPEGVTAALQKAKGAAIDSAKLGEWIVAAVKAHAAGQDQNDDIALLCFGRLEPVSRRSSVESK